MVRKGKKRRVTDLDVDGRKSVLLSGVLNSLRTELYQLDVLITVPEGRRSLYLEMFRIFNVKDNEQRFMLELTVLRYLSQTKVFFFIIPSQIEGYVET